MAINRHMKRVLLGVGAILGAGLVSPMVAGFASGLATPIFSGLSVANAAGAFVGVWLVDAMVKN